MSASGRLSAFQRPLKRRLRTAYALTVAPQPYPQPYSGSRMAIATAVKSQKEEGGKDKGWPLSLKLVGLGIVAVVPPSALKYAIENDMETRNAVKKWIPGGSVLVETLRRRYKDGHFWDENLKCLQIDAELSKLYSEERMFKAEVLCSSGKSSCVVLKARNGVTDLEKMSGCTDGIENVLFLDDDEDVIEKEWLDETQAQVAVSQDENSIWNEVNYSPWLLTVSLANTKNWWERCRSAKEHHSLGNSDAGLSSFSLPEVKELSAKDFPAILEELAKEVQELENEKFNGTRSIDDIDIDIATNKQRQAQLKAKIAPWWRRKWF